ncbi:AAA family ATPase [Rhizobium leguminosarum]|uniref:ATPase AAA n=1 Tax=Rhizobium leguminosarum TaxID=384 RepID=A0A2K9ZGU9_RHILE|nr:AAA family ATPase [Rhizobium leguminosarum]AUW47420.1 ATPase AAA [Rhizobium leguminosarum]
MFPRRQAAAPFPTADENDPNFPRGVPILPLHSLGERIAILGPSNAGKSTLAVALSKKLGIPAVHLDQLHHLPCTDWQSRPEAEFAALHDAAIHEERWIIEGSYSRLMPQRLARATGVIVITSNHWLRFLRYLKRTLANQPDRAGHLQGAKDSIKCGMVYWILLKTRNSGVKYAKVLQEFGLPTVQCHTATALNNLYRIWDLPVRR